MNKFLAKSGYNAALISTAAVPILGMEDCMTSKN